MFNMLLTRVSLSLKAAEEKRPIHDLNGAMNKVARAIYLILESMGKRGGRQMIMKRHVTKGKYVWSMGLALMLCMAGIHISAGETGVKSEGEKKGSVADAAKRGENVKLYSADNILGKDVVNKEGTALGSIEDIVLNDQHSEISYVVLGHGGILGIGEKQIAVPWSDFSVEKKTTTSMTERAVDMIPDSMTQDPQMHQDFKLVLNTTPDQLEHSPGLSGDVWPDRVETIGQQISEMTDQALSRTAEKTVTQATEFELRKVSNLIGMNVRSSRSFGQLETERDESAAREYAPVGRIKDVLFNDNNERLIYCVVSLENIRETGKKDVVTPWESLEFQPTWRHAWLQVPDVDTLLAFPYEAQTQARLSERNYAQQIFQAYNQEPHWEALGFVSPDDATLEKRQQKEGTEKMDKRELKEGKDKMEKRDQKEGTDKMEKREPGDSQNTY